MIDALAITTSNEYAPFAAITLDSFSRNIQTELKCFVIESGISNDARILLANSWKGREQRFLDISEITNLLDALPCSSWHGSSLTLARWFGLELLPDDINTVMCIEADMIAQSNLDELIRADYSEHLIYGVLDAISIDYMERIGLDLDCPYINTGVTVLNLKKARRKQFADSVLIALEENRDSLTYHEQDAVNLACGSEKGAIPVTYNLLTHFVHFPYHDYLEYVSPTQTPFYSEIEYEEARKNPAIVHYSDSVFMDARPWHTTCNHPYVKQYRNYMDAHGVSCTGCDKRKPHWRLYGNNYLNMPARLRPYWRDLYAGYASLAGSIKQLIRTLSH